jgi:hypothetical protein
MPVERPAVAFQLPDDLCGAGSHEAGFKPIGELYTVTKFKPNTSCNYLHKTFKSPLVEGC